MRTILRWLPLGTFLLFGCSNLPQPYAEAPAAAVLTLKQVMEWVIDPAADAVWDAVKTVITEKGTQEIAPKTEEQWNAVRNGAATLAESANLLLIEGRARDNKEWVAAARRLIPAAAQARKAAESRQADALFAAGGEIYKACKACHDRYAPHLTQ